MRTGSPTWRFKVPYPIEIEFEALTRICLPRDQKQKEFIDNELTQDIKRNGLLHPLEITWRLEETQFNKFMIFKGNQRIQALENLGWKKAPCRITIEGYEDTRKIGEVLQHCLG